MITEWQDGAKLCSSMLKDETTVMAFADKLISIAEYYRFDGWLINIENHIHVSYYSKLPYHVYNIHTLIMYSDTLC